MRIWERRYEFFKPARTQSNLRQYNLHQLENILKIAVLNQAGFKISLLCKTGKEEIDQHLKNLQPEEDKQAREISRLIISTFSIDPEAFEATVDSCIEAWGFDDTISLVLIPFIEKIQFFTCRNCEAELYFAVSAMRKKVFSAIENVDAAYAIDRTALLFLPEGEHYDLLLLYYFYLLKSNGLKVLYMGNNVSLEKVRQVMELKKPDFLITYISPMQEKRVEEINHFADNHLKKGMLLAAGFGHLPGKEEQRLNVKFLHYKNVRKFLFQ